MPLYDYVCPKCGSHFEELARVDAPAPTCPKCGHPGATRLVCAPASAPRKGAGPIPALSSGCGGHGGFS